MYFTARRSGIVFFAITTINLVLFLVTYLGNRFPESFRFLETSIPNYRWFFPFYNVFALYISFALSGVAIFIILIGLVFKFYVRVYIFFTRCFFGPYNVFNVS